MTAAWRLTVLLVLTALPLGAQQTPKFSDTTEVTAVEIPVQVLLDGKPVRGLTAESFAVYRDKARQPVTGFEAVDLASISGGSGTDAAEVPVPARRHFLMLFDLSFSEPKSIVQARSAAKDLLADLHPADLVAVATYASAGGPELVLGFTSDRAQIAAAIDSLGLPQLVDRTSDPLRLILEDMREGAKEAMDMVEEASEAVPGVRTDWKPSALSKAVGDLAVLEQMERAEREIDRANVETLKRKVSALTRSFTDLAKFLRSVEGRKYVVYLSEGYDSAILTGTRDKAERDETEVSAEAGRVWEVNSEQRFGHGSATGAVSAMLEEFRRADCIIQAVDIGGLRGAEAGEGALGFERTGGRDSLFQMAHDTGGDLYENFNDLSAAMGTMLERTSVTYVLTIQPEQEPDGSYHTLRIETKGLPRGARVVHRPGYYAPKPFAQRSPTERMLLTAGQVLAGSEGGLVQTSALAVPLPGKPGEGADVPVVIEIDGPSLLHLHQGDDVPVEIYVYAVDGKGKVGDWFAQTVSLDLLKVEAKLLSAGLKFYGHLELPPGSYKARVLVRNGRSGAYGLRVVPIEVAASEQAGPSGPILLPPFFPETNGQWLVLREASRPGRRDVPVPFRMGDRPFLPAALPILGDRESRFALLGYNLAGEGELLVRSQVLTADGREVQAGDLSLVSRAAGESGADRLELSFRPPALQPGEYLLRVTVTDAAGKAGTSTTRFVVAAAGPGERS